MYTLGISAYYHDSAAALLLNGNVIAAAQEERFTRKKHDASFPIQAITYCLNHAGIKLEQVDYIIFYDKPFIKFERILETYLAFAPKGFQSFKLSMPVWIHEKLFQRRLIVKSLSTFTNDFDWENKLLFSEHHLSHAASAFFPSPFRDAAVLTMDGVGEWATTSVAIGTENKLEITKELHFPHSLGLLYSAFTYYTGFKVNSGEYKLMGLAPYGEAKYTQTILNHLIDVKEDGTFRLNQTYFNYCTGLTMVNRKFEELFGQPTRKSESELTNFHMDIAASIQKATEEIVLRLTRAIAQETGMKQLCMAGGVALNCVANGKLIKDNAFKKIWFQPAAGDAGGALGAAYCAYHLYKQNPRTEPETHSMQGSYLGPSFSDEETSNRLTAVKAIFHLLSQEEMIEKTTEAITKEKTIGWMQGRMEFGPRALGNRSIIADPRSTSMQKNLNLKIKFRESFRPFAPSVLREDLNSWFNLDTDSPYMLVVADIQDTKKHPMTTEQESLFGIEKLNIPRSELPAITHVDYSARIQTVHKETNPIYHKLLSAFKAKTGCPVLINTSFNVRGEPIICTPEDAFRCFMGTGLDMLVIGNIILYKEEQDSTLIENYKEKFTLD